MAGPPPTQYAVLDEISLAFQVTGTGPPDLVLVPAFTSHVELLWQEPLVARFLRQLARFARLIIFDKQGTGLSDPVSEPPTVAQRSAEIRAVMEAAGSARAALLAMSEAGSAAIHRAVADPGSVSHLILYGSYPCLVGEPGYFPELAGVAEAVRAAARDTARWGEGRFARRLFLPAEVDDDRAMARLAAYERASASPLMVRRTLEATLRIDVRDLLSQVTVPTLVLHRRGDFHPIELARYMAAGIPGAELVELDGDDYPPWSGDSPAVLGQVERFLTGVRRPAAPERAILTVLFTDIVGSTELASRLRDRAWRDVLERYHDAARAEVERFGGRLVKSTGDGTLATFADPNQALEATQALGSAAAAIGISVTAGLHTGQCELMGNDIGGIAVHIASRVAALAAPGEVLVSATVRDLTLGSDIRLEDRGVHVLRGAPGTWSVYALREG